MSKLLDYNHPVCEKSDELMSVLKQINGDPSSGVEGSNEKTVNEKFGKAADGNAALNRTMTMMTNKEKKEKEEIEEAINQSLINSAADQRKVNEKEKEEESVLKEIGSGFTRMIGVMERFVGEDEDEYLIFGEEIIEQLESDQIQRDLMEEALEKHKARAIRKLKAIKKKEQESRSNTEIQSKKREFIMWLLRCD